MEYVGREDMVVREYDWTDIPPTQAIIETIAAIENVEPMSLMEELGTTLHDHIDPDALERLLTANTDIRIAFTFEKYQIDIDGNMLSVRVD